MTYDLKILRFIYITLTLICIISFITEPGILLNQLSRYFCIGIPATILLFLFLSGSNISSLIKYISVLYLVFVMPRLLMLLYAPEYISSSFEFNNVYQISRGLFIFLTSTSMLFFGLFIGHKLFYSSETKHIDKNMRLLPVAIIFLLTFGVQFFFSFYVGLSPYVKSITDSNKPINDILALLFSLDIISWLILIFVFTSQSRMHSKAWTVLLYLSLFLYMVFSALIGSRGSPIKIFLEAIAIFIITSGSLFLNRKKIVIFFCFLSFFSIFIFPLGNFFRVKLIDPTVTYDDFVNSSSYSINKIGQGNKITYSTIMPMIANRLSAPFDSAILLPYSKKNDLEFEAYINHKYILKSTLNYLLPGVPYPEASISTSRLINHIYRGVSIEHIKNFGYFSEYWTSYALLFLMFGFISIFIHFLIGFLLEFFYEVISCTRIVNPSWLLSFYLPMIPPLILFSMGIDHTISTIFILSIQIFFTLVIYNLLMLWLSLFKNLNLLERKHK